MILSPFSAGSRRPPGGRLRRRPARPQGCPRAQAAIYLHRRRPNLHLLRRRSLLSCLPVNRDKRADAD